MIIQPIPQNSPTFGYHTYLKDCWLSGKLPTVKKAKTVELEIETQD